MAKKKEKAPEKPVFVSERKEAVVNFGDRSVRISVSDYDVKGTVTYKSGDTFYFSSSLM